MKGGLKKIREEIEEMKKERKLMEEKWKREKEKITEKIKGVEKIINREERGGRREREEGVLEERIRRIRK